MNSHTRYISRTLHKPSRFLPISIFTDLRGPFPHSHTASKPIPIPRQLPTRSISKLLLSLFTPPLAEATRTPADVIPLNPGVEVELRVAVSEVASLVTPGAVTAVGIAAADVMSANWPSASAVSVAYTDSVMLVVTFVEVGTVKLGGPVLTK